MKGILLSLLVFCSSVFADTPIDTVLIDYPDGTAIAAYGCDSFVTAGDNGLELLLGECTDFIVGVPFTPLDTAAPLIQVGVFAGQFEYWPSQGNCALLRYAIGTLGEKRWEVSCGEVIFRSAFDE